MVNLTEREMAEFAVALKVPMSGSPALDAMIRESRRLDMATAALAGLINYSPEPEEHREIGELCSQLADALLAASEKEQMK